MNNRIKSIFERDFLLLKSLKQTYDQRQKMRNDYPLKYFILNQNIFINITFFLWMIWQAWVFSAIFILPSPIDNGISGDYVYYVNTLFFRIAHIHNQENLIFLDFYFESYIFMIYTIILCFFSIYTLVVSHLYIVEIRNAVKDSLITKWKHRIRFFLVFIYFVFFLGMGMIFWIVSSLFYIPKIPDSSGVIQQTLLYTIPDKTNFVNNVKHATYTWLGIAVIIVNGFNFVQIVSSYIYWIHHQFAGYRYFFAFEKKQWKKIDNFVEKIKFAEKKQIQKDNEPHKGSYQAVNNPGYVIEIKNVNKFFLSAGVKFHALKDINLQIKAGEFVVILGPSGSGKTTLLNIISGVDRPGSGEIVVANHNILNMNSEQLTKFRKDKTGYIFQQYSLLPNLTARENISIGYYLGQANNRYLTKTNYLSQRKAAKTMREKARIFVNYWSSKFKPNSIKNQLLDDVIKLLGISEQAHKYPSQLSGGQQQRVAIARAFIKQPEILFGDEPTGALNLETTKKILELFHLINKVTKTTVLMVTHNPKIAEMADRVIEVNNGMIKRNQFNPEPKKVSEISFQ